MSRKDFMTAEERIQPSNEFAVYPWALDSNVDETRYNTRADFHRVHVATFTEDREGPIGLLSQSEG